MSWYLLAKICGGEDSSPSTVLIDTANNRQQIKRKMEGHIRKGYITAPSHPDHELYIPIGRIQAFHIKSD
jgi:hypothetical protein